MFNLISPTLSFSNDDRSAQWWLLPKWTNYITEYIRKCLDMIIMMKLWNLINHFYAIFNSHFLLSHNLNLYSNDSSAQLWLLMKWTDYMGVYIGKYLDVLMLMKLSNKLFSSSFNLISPTLSFSDDDRSTQ
jgi:hypothetical protein